MDYAKSIGYNKRLYNIAKNRLKIAEKIGRSSISAINYLYLTKLDLANQRKRKLDMLIFKANNAKKPNAARIDKLLTMREKQLKLISDLKK